MAANADITAAIEHLEKFLAQGDWEPRLAASREAMVVSVLADTTLGFEELIATLDEFGLVGSFAAYVDEACFCARLGPDGANAIDAYLARRGWQESPRARAYLQGMRDSTPTVWEVRATQPGAWVDVVDRFGDGTTVRVTERSASAELQRYDRLVARVVPVHDVSLFAGGVLLLEHTAAERLEAELRRLARRGQAPREDITLTCLRFWASAVLHAARRPLPELQTTHGEPLVLGRTRLTLSAGVTPREIERRLDAARPQGWEREGASDDQLAWVWFGADGASSNGDAAAAAGDNNSDDRALQGTILAAVRSEGPDAFVVETMSRARMERALESLKAMLAGLVTPGLTSYEDPLQGLETRRSGSRRVAPSSSAPTPVLDDDSIDPANAADMVQQVTDAHYRRTLDETVPMLGNRTPRECSRTKAGRKKLVSWLKYVENAELHRASRFDTEPYDFGWMWRELGLDDER